MNLILYSKSNSVGRRLRKIVHDTIREGQVEIFPVLEEFSLRLRRTVGSITVVVLVASTLEELDVLLRDGEVVREVRSILILPDRSPETVSKGHTLYPRFVSYIDSDFKDFEAVLKKMNRQMGTRFDDLSDGEIPVEIHSKQPGSGSGFDAHITDG